MKISVITVSYNAAATIEETIASVLSQDHPDLEYIVVDGGSTDGTPAILERHLARLAHAVSERDDGMYDAMNKGLALATGDVVAILNSDDLYGSPDVLSRVAERFAADPALDCLSTDVEIFAGSRDNVVRHYGCAGWKPWMFRIGHQPPHPGFFVRRRCYERVGRFNPAYGTAADFDMLLRLVHKHRCRTRFEPWVSVAMRAGGASQRGLGSIARANRRVNQSLRDNGYPSALPLVWAKYFLKILQLRPRRAGR
jgi:glycosyltransferase involved in cell wall biosynthesis